MEDNQNAEKMSNTFFDDGSIEIEVGNSTTGDLVNHFTNYFKNKMRKPKHTSFFEGIDSNDPISTNMIMEELFSEMMKYKEGSDEFIQVIKYNELTKDMTTNDELYCIMRNDEPFFVSQCLFSILLEFTEMYKSVGHKYSLRIVDLK